MATDSTTAEQGSDTRFYPWLTWGLLLLCTISLAHTQDLTSEIRATAHAKLDRAADYFEEHPYLDYSPFLDERMGSVNIEKLRELFEAERRTRRLAPIPSGVASRHQGTFDELVAKGVAPYDDLPKYRMGLRATERRPTTWVTYPLIHAGWLHWLGNGLLLLVIGTTLERVWRREVFGGFLIASPFVAGGAMVLVNPLLADPLIGIVGITAGLLGAFSVRHGKIWEGPRYLVLLAAGMGWLIGPAMLGWDLNIALLLTSVAQPAGFVGSSLSAVAGAFGFGMLTAIIVSLVGIERQLPDDAAQHNALSSEEVLANVESARADGRAEEAFAQLENLARQEPNNLTALFALWEVSNELGRSERAAVAMTHIIELEIRSGSKQDAIEHWFELIARRLENHAQPGLLIRIGLLLAAENRNSDAVHAFEVALRKADDGEKTAPIVARIARAARDVDPVLAEDAAWRALAASDLGIEERQGLEALLAQLRPRAGAAAERIINGCLQEPVESSDEPTEAAGIDTLETQVSEPLADQDAFAPPPPSSTEESADPPVDWDDSDNIDDDSELDDAVPAAADFGKQWVDDDPDSALHSVSIAFEFRSRELEFIEAVPITIADDGLTIELDSGDKKLITYDRVDAIAVAAIAGDTKTVLLVDLVLNWNAGSERALKAVRLRGDQFDPRRLVRTESAPIDAMREMIDQLLQHTQATPLPDLDAVRGYPFASFADIESYESSILSVEPASDAMSE